MTNDDVIDRVRELIASRLGAGSALPGDDESLFLSGRLDSLAMLSLVILVEERFGIPVSDVDVLPENFETILRLSEFIERKRREALGSRGTNRS